MATEYQEVGFQSLFAMPLRNGLTRPKSMRGAGIKMVNMGEIFAYSRIGDIPMDRVPVSERELLDYRLEKGDLLFARQSLVAEGAGKCSIVLDAPEPLTFESHIIRARLDPEVACPAYYYYFFTSSLGRQIMGSIVEQVAAAGIRGSDLARLGVPHPSIREQRAIARILSAFDDKIELNRRMNATLEAMARALFKSWFVDFDPVRAKAEGQRLAGMDAETAALFPVRLEESELGPLPAGWETGHLGDIIELIGGGTPKTTVSEYWGGDIPWFAVVDAPAESDIFVLTTQKTITQAGLENSSTRMLPPKTTIISARGTVGKCAMVAVPMAMNQSCYGVRGSDGRGDYYTYFTVRQSVADLKRGSHGSIFDTITRSTFDAMSIVIPPSRLTQVYDRMVSPWIERILANLRESHTLVELRDALLPKLLLGEVRVKEAEEAVATGALA